MIKIKLTQNQTALIDDEDYEVISKYNWYTRKTKNTFYAVAHTYKNNKRTIVQMHRIIMNPEPKEEVDHINHHGLDNRRGNLRVCSRQQNQFNKLPNNKTSRYKGVCWHKRKKKWQATIGLENKQKWIGYFSNEVEAARAYDQVALKYFGEFAYLNL